MTYYPRPDPAETSALLDTLHPPHLRGLPFKDFAAPTTYRVRYEMHPDHLDSYDEVCIAELGGTYPGKAQSLPDCSTLDTASLAAWNTLAPAPMYAAAPVWSAVGGGHGLAGGAGRADGHNAHGASHGGGGSFAVAYARANSDALVIVESPGWRSEPDPFIPSVPLPAAGGLLLVAVAALLVARRV